MAVKQGAGVVPSPNSYNWCTWPGGHPEMKCKSKKKVTLPGPSPDMYDLTYKTSAMIMEIVL